MYLSELYEQIKGDHNYFVVFISANMFKLFDTVDRRRELLLEAMTEVLSNVSTSNEYTLVLQADKQQSVMTENPVIENIAEGGQEPPTDHNTFHSSLR